MSETEQDSNEAVIATCWRCNKKILEGETVWGYGNRKWCSLEHKRQDEAGDWV